MPIRHQRTITAAVVSAYPWVPLNQYAVPFNVGFGISKGGTGDTTFRVEHTFDNVLTGASAGSVFTHIDVSAATASRDGNYAYPVAAVRLNVASVSGAATLVFSVLQTGY